MIMQQLKYFILIILSFVVSQAQAQVNENAPPVINEVVDANDKIEQSVHSSMEVNKSASDVWEFVSNWNNLNLLVPKVVERTEVKGNGITTNWIIYLKNGSVVKERMTYFDNRQRLMSYIMTETPMPLTDYLATIQVIPVSKVKCNIIFSTYFKVEEKNKAKLLTTFEAFQNTYLSNIEKVLE